MKEFADKVAVVTGAASGIGRAMAERFAREGMKVVMADVEEAALAQTARAMQSAGATVLAVPTDVSRAIDIEALAQKTCDTFGAVHVLCNNAGVASEEMRCVWENTVADWTWIMGVNLWGVIHGVRVFVPIMMAQDTACHIVNTASMAGLISSPRLGMYNVTKHGVVTLSETLHHELAMRGAEIKVSVLCPGIVNTRITEARRNRPAELQNAPAGTRRSPKSEAQREAYSQAFQSGMSAQQVADEVFEAIQTEKFYILTHPERKPMVRMRLEDILLDRNPTSPGA